MQVTRISHFPPIASSNGSKIRHRIRFNLALALLLLSAFACPASAETEVNSGKQQLSLDQLRSFSDAMNIVRTHYVEEVTDQQLLDAALRGMLASLDPHSEVLDAKSLEQQSENNSGRQGGIGIETMVRRQKLFVSGVVEGSPASRVGLRPGDQILKIDDLAVRGRPLSESIEALRGAPGTSVKLTTRSSDRAARKHELEREYISVPSVEALLLDPGIAYLGLNQFHRGSPEELKAGLDRLTLDQAGGELNGIILDLRNNRGGTIIAAMDIADGFLTEGLVVHTEGRSASSELEYIATPGEWAKDIPLMVLINRNSASASEILAGALQDNGRARLVGEKSFGKGSVQSMLTLRDGQGIKLTTARYLTPAGNIIEGHGIEPDFIIDDVTQNPGEPSQDPVLTAALQQLLRGG